MIDHECTEVQPKATGPGGNLASTGSKRKFFHPHYRKLNDNFGEFTTAAHSALKSHNIEFAVEVARQMERNKKETSITVKDPAVTKVNTYQNTVMTNRKEIAKLCVNISDHIANTHKISKSDDK